MNKAREFDQSVLAELKALLGDRVSTSAAVREHHGKDESYFPYALPDVVVFVARGKDGARLVREIAGLEDAGPVVVWRAGETSIRPLPGRLRERLS